MYQKRRGQILLITIWKYLINVFRKGEGCRQKTIKRLKTKKILPGKAVLLIPQKYEKDQERILKRAWGWKKRIFYFIKDRQVYQDMLSPGYYAIDPIIYAHKSKETVVAANGEKIFIFLEKVHRY